MADKKRLSTIICLMLVIVCSMSTIFSLTAFAQTNKTQTEVSEFYTANIDAVEQSGIDKDGMFSALYNQAQTGTQTVVDDMYNKMSLIFELAEKVNLFKAEFADEALVGKYAPKTVVKIKSIRDAVLESCFIEKATVADYALLTAETEKLAQSLADAQNQILALADNDVTDFEIAKQKAAEEVFDEYNAMVSKTESAALNSNITAYKKELEKILDSYIIIDGDKVGIKTGGLFDITYVAAQASACTEQLNAALDKAKTQLKAYPSNAIEEAALALSDFRDLENRIKQAETNGATQSEINALIAELQNMQAPLEEKAKKAVSLYQQKTPVEYSAEVKLLQAFLEGEPSLYVKPECISKVFTKAVKVTAVYADDNTQEAKVIPYNCTVVVYANANGSAKRNASQMIKEKNGELSVAYFISISVKYANENQTYPTTTAKLPAADENGRKVVYKVELNLKEYYENYCQARGYEKDKLQNITDAVALSGETSLCYVYSQKVSQDKSEMLLEECNYTLDGENLVFYTPHFSYFCIAGAGLDSLLTEPSFYLILIIVIILLIIIVKALLKHWKYAIKFESNGGSPVKTIRVAKNEAIVLPADPEKPEFVFAGWYTDKELTKRFIDTKLKRRGSIKLYAKWASPVSAEQLNEYYDNIRHLLTSYEKRSFKPTLGVEEKELLANMFGEERNIVLYLALKPERAKSIAGALKLDHSDKQFANLPTKIVIASEETYQTAVKLAKKTLLDKGLQLKDEQPEKIVSTPEERAAGFAYFVKNERVVNRPEDYFEMLRIYLKSYVLEKDNGMFKSGDKFTFARIYKTAKEVNLYLPDVKDVKELEKGTRDQRFEDTPVRFIVCDNTDLQLAIELIDKCMVAYGFVKCPENSNDLTDVDLPDTNGFAYTVKF